MKNVKKRLEHLRKQLRAERISYGEIAELQSLAKHIEPHDVELLEAAGVPEHAEAQSNIVLLEKVTQAAKMGGKLTNELWDEAHKAIGEHYRGQRCPLPLRGRDPSYVAADNLECFLAYGLMCCWPSHTDAMNEDWYDDTPFEFGQIQELRGYFLDVVLDAAAKHKADKSYRGDLDCEHQHIYVGDIIVTWYAKFLDDCLMFELHNSNDGTTDSIFLEYEALKAVATKVKQARKALTVRPN
jgi:hypothetical protein